jgi:hypothetical protein
MKAGPKHALGYLHLANSFVVFVSSSSFLILNRESGCFFGLMGYNIEILISICSFLLDMNTLLKGGLDLD